MYSDYKAIIKQLCIVVIKAESVRIKPPQKYNLEKYDNLYDYIISLSKESEDKKRSAG
jgi:hypothetical protein